MSVKNKNKKQIQLLMSVSLRGEKLNWYLLNKVLMDPYMDPPQTKKL